MKAMVCRQITDLKRNKIPLASEEVKRPQPGEEEILIHVTACGVCHTELDEIEGRTPPPHLPVIPGHQVIGRVVDTGPLSKRFRLGDRVGIAWIHSACGTCHHCLAGVENLCSDFKATGRDVDGGYAQYTTVSENFAHHIPDIFSDVEAAPLLCAGAIGLRSLKLSQLRKGQRLGLTGFGASGHLVLKTVRSQFPDVEIYVFARSQQEREFATQLGAHWTGSNTEAPPEKLNSIIDTTPAWKPVVAALDNLLPGGRLVINAIRKEVGDQNELLKIDYPRHLWMEKEIKSVANVTRKDVSDFLDLAAEIPFRPEVQEYPLEEANKALVDLKERRIRGAKVLTIE